MSDDRRRLMCRIAFVVCCALPTILVANWILFPRSTAQWQTLARQTLGCRVAIASIATPTPNEVRFHQFRILNAQMQPLVDMRTVDLSQSLDGYVLTLSPIEQTLGQVTGLLQNLAEQLPKMDWKSGTTTVQIQRLTIRSDIEGATTEHCFVAKDCLMQIEPRGTQTRVVIEFRSDVADATRIRWELQFGDPSQPEQWTLDTSNGLLPCWLLAKVWPAAQSLGNDCWFSGILKCERSDSHVAYDVQDLRLVNLDVPKMLCDVCGTRRETMPIAASTGSQFEAIVKNGRVINGRLDSLLCQIHCPSGGYFDPSWLLTTKKWLQVDVVEPINTASVEFAKLLVGFEIRDGELFVWGDSNNGLIAVDPNQRPLIVATPASQRLSPQCLAGWFSGVDQIQIPVSSAAQQMLSHLPLVR